MSPQPAFPTSRHTRTVRVVLAGMALSPIAARAEAPCSLTEPVSVGVVPREPSAIAVGVGPDVGVVVVAGEDASVAASIDREGHVGPLVPLPSTLRGRLLPPIATGSRFVLRQTTLCPPPNRFFHKCIGLRVFDPASGAVGPEHVEDVVEWTGESAAADASRLVMVRAPMYDAEGTPTVTTFAITADGRLERLEHRALGRALADAHVALGLGPRGYDVWLASPVSGDAMRWLEGSEPRIAPSFAPFASLTPRLVYAGGLPFVLSGSGAGARVLGLSSLEDVALRRVAADALPPEVAREASTSLATTREGLVLRMPGSLPTVVEATAPRAYAASRWAAELALATVAAGPGPLTVRVRRARCSE